LVFKGGRELFSQQDLYNDSKNNTSTTKNLNDRTIIIGIYYIQLK